MHLAAVIELVPKKVYAASVAALFAVAVAAGVGVASLKMKNSALSATHAQLRARVAEESSVRERVAREAVQQRAREELRHSEIQQRNVRAYHNQEAADRAADRDRDTELARLRHEVRAYAAGGDRAGEADPHTCRDQRDRSERLGGLVEEALQLQGESESFIRQRDREVKLLQETLRNDRALTPDEKDPR